MVQYCGGRKIGELNVICQFFTQVNPVEIVISVVAKLMIKDKMWLMK